MLLEGNPLPGPSLAALFAEAAGSSVRTLGLDVTQARAFAEACPSEEAQDLAPCISVGDLLRTGSPAQHYLKLVCASQLRRGAGVRATGLPGGPAPPREAPGKLLVVAFAASQGEPEWMGVLRRLLAAGQGSVAPLAPPLGPLGDLLRGPGAEAWMAELWAGWKRGAAGPMGQSDDHAQSAPKDAGADAGVAMGMDMDILIVVDHRMQWYAEDPALPRVLAEVVAQHERSLFVGASMGGFGALLHGGRLADAVLAFGPQVRLDQAILRPPAADLGGLESMAARVCDSVRVARARGAVCEVHCAADEHFWHGINLPLQDDGLTVHPLMPRKPFAKLLDAAGLLEPILLDALVRVLRLPPARRTVAPDREPGGIPNGFAALPREDQQGPARVLVAEWLSQGGARRRWSSREELLRLLFGPGAPTMPRPGDWFCGLCGGRSMAARFFCGACGVRAGSAATVADAAAARVPGRGDYPLPGDWGCGACGNAHNAQAAACSRSPGATKKSARLTRQV